jgi:hypothetical protein
MLLDEYQCFLPSFRAPRVIDLFNISVILQLCSMHTDSRHLSWRGSYIESAQNGSALCQVKIGYKKNKMSTDRERGRGNKRARVTSGSRNPKHGKKKALHCALTWQIIN